MGLPESLVLLVECVDAVNHLLDQLDLAVAQPVLVRDVVGDPGLAAGLAPGAPGLKVELLAPGRQHLGAQLGPAREVNVDRGPHACAQVGGACVDVAVSRIKHEVMTRLLLDRVLHSLDTASKSVKHLLDITALLHGDDPELILLDDPGQKGLVLVVEDTTTLGPDTLHAGHLEVGVSRHEEEVVIDQLLPDLLTHAGEGEVGAGQVSLQVGKSLLHQVLHINPLLLCDSGGKTKAVDVPADPDPGGVDGGGGVNGALDLAGVHVACVVGGDAMELLDQRIKHVREDLVRISVSGVDTAMLVVKLHGTGDGLGECEPKGSGLGPAELLPEGLVHVIILTS